jgi:Lon protease-like protein
VVDEDVSKPYRLARVEPIVEITTAEEKAAVSTLRRRLEAVIAATVERGTGEPRFPPAVPDEDLINGLSQYLDLDPLERQALLERDTLLARANGLLELLEMKRLAGGAGGPFVH